MNKSSQEKGHCIAGAAIIICFFIFSASTSSATWKRIAQFKTTVNASFFFNEQRGFIGIDGQNGILRTSDGGKTWFNCNIPINFIGFITDIFMKDSLNGWATIEEYGNNFANGLWFTVDGGINWQVDSKISGLITSVYQTPTALVIGDRYTLNRLSYSADGGLSFVRSSLDRFNGINFVDNLHGVVTPYQGTARFTADGGITWQPTSAVTTESWGVYAEKGTPNFIVAGEKYQGDGSNWENIFTSSDYGATWQTASTIVGRTTGHIAGVGRVSYVQYWTPYQFPNQIVGMSRSTDGGQTWTPVGGPSNFRDTRFSVTGCLGGVVYAFDEWGGVWKTTDGGDGQIHEPPHNPNVIPDHVDLAATLCSQASSKLSYNNLSCNPLTIESIGFIDSTDPLITTGALSFSKYPTLPQTLDPTFADNVVVNWDPKKFGVQKPLSTTYVKIHSSMLGGTLTFDTLIAVNSQSFANQPIFSLNTTNVKFDSMNICRRFMDTTITITNSSCDTLWLDSTLLSASKDWNLLDSHTLLPLSLPLGMAYGESANFVIRFYPSGVGGQTAKLQLHFTHQGITRDTSLSFAGFCYRIVSVLADRKVSFAPTSICDIKDSMILFQNLSCDTLNIFQVTNSDPSGFKDISGSIFPIQIPPGGILPYYIRFAALKNTSSNSLVIFHYNIAEDTAIWETTLTGSGVPGTSFFETSSATSQLIFPDTVACNPEDSMVFTIFNPGCDSLSVLSSQISIGGMPAISYKTDPPLPFILCKPGASVKVTVYRQADLPSTNDGTLTFSYFLSDGTRHDSVFSIHAFVYRGERIAAVSENPIDMGLGSLCLNRDTAIVISNPGCPSLTVENISVNGNYFALINPRATPFDLARGESYTAHVTFLPTTSGLQTGQLQITTNADLRTVRTIPLSADTRQIDHLTFRLVNESPGIYTGDSVYLTIVPDIDWSGKDLRNIDFSITTNGDLLWTDGKHIQQQDNTFQTIATPVTVGKDCQLNVQLKSPTEIVLHKDQPLVRFSYITAITDTINTPVTLSLLSLNNSDAHYANCILSSSSEDADFTLNLACGQKTLLDFLGGKVPILSDEVRPNPVTSQTNYLARLPFTSAITGTAEVNYYDALGKKVAGETIVIAKAGKYSAHFDGSLMAGGTYEYSIRLKENASASARGRIILLK